MAIEKKILTCSPTHSSDFKIPESLKVKMYTITTKEVLEKWFSKLLEK